MIFSFCDSVSIVARDSGVCSEDSPLVVLLMGLYVACTNHVLLLSLKSVNNLDSYQISHFNIVLNKGGHY